MKQTGFEPGGEMMRLVPDEPTDRMCVNGAAVMLDADLKDVERIYKAMLAAAPAASGDELVARLQDCASHFERGFPGSQFFDHALRQTLDDAAAALCARSEIIEECAKVCEANADAHTAPDWANQACAGQARMDAKAIRSLK